MKRLFICILIVSAAVSCGNNDKTVSGPVVLDIGSTVGASRENFADAVKLFEVAGCTAVQTDSDNLLGYPYIFGYKDGILYLNDNKGSVWQVRESDGVVLSRFLKKGNGPGEFISVGNVSFDRFHDRILISDPIKNKILAYSADGKWLPEYSKDSLCGVSVLADGSIAGLEPVGASPLSNETGVTQACYDIYDSDWNMLRKGSVMANTKKTRIVPYVVPTYSTEGGCYYMPFRNDTLFRITHEADIPFIVFDKGRYAPADEWYENLSATGSPVITTMKAMVIGEYVFCEFFLAVDRTIYRQIWRLSGPELVFNSYSDKSPDALKLDVGGETISFWPEAIVGGMIFFVPDYRDAVKLVPELEEDDNPVIVRVRYKGNEGRQACA